MYIRKYEKGRNFVIASVILVVFSLALLLAVLENGIKIGPQTIHKIIASVAFIFALSVLFRAIVLFRENKRRSIVFIGKFGPVGPMMSKMYIYFYLISGFLFTLASTSWLFILIFSI